jgi:hypothetical protein
MIVIGKSLGNNTAPLPAYIGTAASDAEVVGMANDNNSIIVDQLGMIAYCHALGGGVVSVGSSPDSSPIPRVNSLSYSGILRRLTEMSRWIEADDLGRVRPSEMAAQTAAEVAFRILQTGVGGAELPDISTDRDGDIRFLWETGERSLELVCPFNQAQRPYIYFSGPDEFAIAYDLSVYRLGQLFAWLHGHSDRFPR